MSEEIIMDNYETLEKLMDFMFSNQEGKSISQRNGTVFILNINKEAANKFQADLNQYAHLFTTLNGIYIPQLSFNQGDYVEYMGPNGFKLILKIKYIKEDE